MAGDGASCGERLAWVPVEHGVKSTLVAKVALIAGAVRAPGERSTLGPQPSGVDERMGQPSRCKASTHAYLNGTDMEGDRDDRHRHHHGKPAR